MTLCFIGPRQMSASLLFFTSSPTLMTCKRSP